MIAVADSARAEEIGGRSFHGAFDDPAIADHDEDALASKVAGSDGVDVKIHNSHLKALGSVKLGDLADRSADHLIDGHARSSHLHGRLSGSV